MIRRRTHWIEKLQVQLAVAVAIVATYCLIWPVVEPPDPAEPVTFIAVGGWRGVSILAVLSAALAVVCGALTVAARPQSAAMVLVFGLGGLSLRSAPMRTLLFVRQGDLPAMYWGMLVEFLLLLGLLLAGASIAGLVRQGVGHLFPRCLWRDPLAGLTEEQRTAHNLAMAEKRRDEWSVALKLTLVGGLFGWGFVPVGSGGRLPGKETAVRGVLCFLVTLVVSSVLMLLLMRSTDRGQILFALVAGNFVGVWLAQQAVPTRLNLVAWTVPLVLGAALYVLAATSIVLEGAGAWKQIPTYAQALPIDWATAGVGGSMLGHWVSLRMREARFIEQEDEETAKGT